MRLLESTGKGCMTCLPRSTCALLWVSRIQLNRLQKAVSDCLSGQLAVVFIFLLNAQPTCCLMKCFLNCCHSILLCSVLLC